MRVLSSLIGILLAAPLLAPAIASADCADYAGYPQVVGSADTPGQAIDVVVSGHYAYVADNVPGLQVFDIRHPEYPDLVATLLLPGPARALAVAGIHAYVGAGNRLHVVDISNPYQLCFVAELATVRSPKAVTISGNRAYLGESSTYPDSIGTLELIDIANPLSPRTLGSVDVPDGIEGVAVAGNHAYIAAGSAGLLTVDVTDPGNPQISGGIDWPSIARDVSVADGYAYVATGDGVKVVDISRPDDPQLVGELDTQCCALGISVAGTFAYITESQGGEWYQVPLVRAIDITDPQHPAVVANVLIPSDGYEAVLSGEHVFVATDEAGLLAIDVGPLLYPPLVGAIDTPHHAGDVAIARGHAYIADGWAGLIVVDVSDPSHCTIVGSSSEPVFAGSLELAEGRYAYVSTRASFTLAVLDIADPRNPSLLGSASLLYDPLDVAVSGDFVYVAEHTMYEPLFSAIEIVDVSRPMSPVVVSSLLLPELTNASHLAVSGSYAYVTAWRCMYVVDISDPLQPFIVAALTTAGYTCGICVAGSLAYVTTVDNRLLVFDLSSPPLLNLVAELALNDQSWGVAVAGCYAYLSGVGIQIIDITDPVHPQQIGPTYMPEQDEAVTYADGYLYVARAYAGLKILREQCCETSAVLEATGATAFATIRCVPNPSTGSTQIHFTSGDDGWAQASIYDIRGGLVRRLPPRFLGASNRTISWDGRDEQNRPVAQGVYLVRAAIANRIQTGRIVIVR